MKYLTDLFETHWNDELVDRTDEIKAEKQRLAENRGEPKWPTADESRQASKTYSEHPQGASHE
ncbi:MAG: hypothetical protein V3V40_06115 [Nitrosomonadaceae bacterium]